MEKIMIGKTNISISPTVIVGALVNGKANYLTLGNYGGICPRPPVTIYISVNKAHYTNNGIKESGYFSVNIPSKDLLQKADYVGLVSGKDTDKSSVFASFYGSIKAAPMIAECPVNILCKLAQTIDQPSQEIFLGEIIETYVAKEYLSDNKPDFKKINPLIMGGGWYWELGNKAGATFSDGKALIKR
jgi:flavin reductase (DIM6/NTAB) family NADH-FMN oxidoreductase RutF